MEVFFVEALWVVKLLGFFMILKIMGTLASLVLTIRSYYDLQAKMREGAEDLKAAITFMSKGSENGNDTQTKH